VVSRAGLHMGLYLLEPLNSIFKGNKIVLSLFERKDDAVSSKFR
jgi:hypothetical protein